MSLRRRIAVATALAVAAVAIAIGVVGYPSTRSHLIGEVKQELRARAQPMCGDIPPGAPAAASRAKGARHGRARRRSAAALPPGPALGGAPGYFQFVYPDGKAVAPAGGTPQLRVDAQRPEIARAARAAASSPPPDVHGVHAEVYTVADTQGRLRGAGRAAADRTSTPC